jgi:hypothetical protein
MYGQQYSPVKMTNYRKIRKDGIIASVRGICFVWESRDELDGCQFQEATRQEAWEVHLPIGGIDAD